MNKYVSLLDDILVDFLTDIKSLRYQLVLAGFFFNIFLFQKGAPPSVMLGAIGLLTAIYGLYFSSRQKQAEIENTQKAEEADPQIERDPDL